MEGPRFLKKKFNVHDTKEVKSAASRTEKRTGEKVPQKPEAQIQNYLNRFKEIIEREDPKEKERGVRALEKILQKEYIIKEENIPESCFELRQRIAREQGCGDIEITEEIREESIKVIQEDQKNSLHIWVEYLASDDALYPDWTKYWAFRSILTMSTYDKEKHVFGKRSKNTTAPFPDLNREALSYVVDIIEKKSRNEEIDNPVQVDENEFAEEEKLVSDEDFQKLLSTENFAKYYAFAIEHVTADSSELYKITEGEWKLFKRGSDASELTGAIQGHGTGWCTAGEHTASAQLEQGDFYVYFSKNNLGEAKIPRLAIRMQNNSIAEVRGVAPDQNIDPYINPILEEKMNEFGQEGEVYKKKAEDMQRVTEIDAKNKNGESLTKEDLRFLYEIDANINGFGYKKDPRIEEIIASRGWKEDMETIFDAESDVDLANKLIDAGRVASVAERLKNFEGLNTEVALKLIEAGKGDFVAQRLKYFEGINHNDIALKLIESERCVSVAKYLKNFEGINHNYIALKIIESGDGAYVAKHLENFEGLNTEVALKLIEAGKGYSVARHLKSFEGLNIEFALKLIEAGKGYSVAEHLKSFEGLNHADIANKIIESGEGWSVAKHLENFEGLNHADIANKIIESGHGDSVIEYLKNFEGLNHNYIAFKLIEAGEGWYVAKRLKNFEGLNTEVAFKLIEAGKGYSVAEHLENFEGINHNDTALKIIESGEGWSVAKHLKNFEGLNHNDIALKLIEAGDGNYVVKYIESFEGLNTEIIDKLKIKD